MSHSAEHRAALLAAHWSHCPAKRAAVIAKIAASTKGRVVGPETRAKMSASQRLVLPPADVAAVLQLYTTMGLIPVAKRMGYHRRVVERVLREQGVALRSPGNQQGRA